MRVPSLTCMLHRQSYDQASDLKLASWSIYMRFELAARSAVDVELVQFCLL